jgi:hypothetical protein
MFLRIAIIPPPQLPADPYVDPLLGRRLKAAYSDTSSVLRLENNVWLLSVEPDPDSLELDF